MTPIAQQDKRAAILSAMLDLVVERGFHDAPMSMLAARAGVSTGVIYHYFDGKDDVIHALATQVNHDLGEALIVGDPHLLPFPMDIERVWLNSFNHYVAHPHATIFQEQYKNAPFTHHVANDLDDNTRLLLEKIQLDIDDGFVRPMPFEVLYDLTTGVALALAKRQIRGEVIFTNDDLRVLARGCRRAVEP